MNSKYAAIMKTVDRDGNDEWVLAYEYSGEYERVNSLAKLESMVIEGEIPLKKNEVSRVLIKK